MYLHSYVYLYINIYMHIYMHMYNGDILRTIALHLVFVCGSVRRDIYCCRFLAVCLVGSSLGPPL